MNCWHDAHNPWIFVNSTSKDFLFITTNITLKIGKLMLICNYHISHKTPRMFSSKIIQSRITVVSCHFSLFFFNLEQFLSPSLTFMISTLLKIPGEIFCRVSFNLHLCDISSWLDLDYASLAKYHRDDVSFLSASSQRAHVLICPITANVNFDYLIKVMPARFLHCKKKKSCSFPFCNL